MKKTIYTLVIIQIMALTSLQSQSWIPQGAGMLPVGYIMFSISVVNDSVVWAIACDYAEFNNTSGTGVSPGHISKVLRTTDAGETWQSHDVEESMGRVSYNIEAVDANTAWISSQDFGSGLGRALYNTADGGNTWTQKLLHRAGGVFVRVFDEQHIMCQNNRYKAWSMDGGENWSVDTLEQYGASEYNLVASANNMACTVGDTLWVGTSEGRIVRTINYGETTEFFETGFSIIQCVSFKDHENGMLFYYNSSTDFGTAISTDGGVNWEATPTKPFTNFEYNLTYVPGTAGTFITATDHFNDNNEVFWTTDFGETWLPAESIEGNFTNCIDFSSPTSGWVAAGGPITSETVPILFRYSGDPLTGSQHLPAPIAKFHLYPNPVADYINVTFTSPTAGQLLLHDVNGCLLYQKAITKTDLSTSIDLRDLPAGVYTVTVSSVEGVVVEQVVKR